MRTILTILTILLLAGCKTTKNRLDVESKTTSNQLIISKDSVKLIEKKDKTSAVNFNKDDSYFKYLELTPTNQNGTATYTIYENGKEVFKQEVKNGTLKTNTEKKEKLVIKDTVYITQEKIVYKYKTDTIFIDKKQNISHQEESNPNLFLLISKLVPWWVYVLLTVAIVIFVFWKSIKLYLKSVFKI